MIKKENYIDMYKLHCEMADRISQRRHNSNTFYLSVQSTLVSLLMIISNYFKGDFSIVILFSVLSIIISTSWIIQICSYKKLNTAKYNILQKFEKIIGINFYSTEWKLLAKGKYKPLSIIESCVPLAFIIIVIANIILFYCSTKN